MKRVLFIVYPYAGTGANMLRYKSLSYDLVNRGYDVDVIGYYELNEVLPPEIQYYRIKAQFSWLFFVVFISLAIEYLFLIRVQGLAGFVRRIGLATATYSMTASLIKKQKYDSCLISVAPWANYLIVNRIKKSIKVVVDICDPLYKNAINTSSESFANFRLEKRALLAADCVITVNEPSISIMTEEMGINPEKIHFITPAMHVDKPDCGDRTFCRFSYPIKIVYSGSLYEGYRDLNEVIPVIESIPCLSLDIYTGSPCKPKSTDRIRVHQIVPHDEILALYKQFDILLFIDNFYGFQVPSKIFELVAQNKPILFVYDERNMYLHNLLKGQEGIIFVENKRDSLKDALNNLISSREVYVHYTLDLSEYTESSVNKQLCSCLLNLR